MEGVGVDGKRLCQKHRENEIRGERWTGKSDSRGGSCDERQKVVLDKMKNGGTCREWGIVRICFVRERVTSIS